MKILTLCISILFLLSGLVTAVSAAEGNRKSGVETSTEHKSGEGLEHGKAVAGSKEKAAEEEDADDEEAADVEDEEDDSGVGNSDHEDKAKGKSKY